jgi:iron complex outermembrane receptor protein
MARSWLSMGGGLSAFSLGALLLAAGAHGQQTTGSAPSQAAPPALEEIVVTARYKSESSQDVPVSITVLDSQALEARGLDNVLDLAQQAPNVSLRPAGSTNGKAISAYIRGVGQSDANFAFDPGVGFYLDDVYFGTILGSQFALSDVDQVQVLRGPQGTLFGENSVGGAIRISSVQPKGDDSGYLEVGVGSYNRRQIKGAMDFNVIPDVLAVRVSGGSNNTEGYVNVIDYVCANPTTSGNLKPQSSGSGASCQTGREGGGSVDVARVSVRYTPNPDLAVFFSADVADDIGEAQAETLIAFRGGPGTAINAYNTGVLLNPGSGFYTGIPIDSRFLPPNPYTTYASFSDPSTGRTMPNESDVRQHGYTAKIDWGQSDAFHVKTILGYRAYDAQFATDTSNAPMATTFAYNYDYHTQTSEELQLSGVAFDKFLDWAAGAYHYDAHEENPGFTSLVTNQFGPFYGLAFDFTNSIVAKNSSGFLHTDLNFTNQFSLELGTRYTSESKYYQFGRVIIASNPGDPIFPVGQPLAGFGGLPSSTETASRFDYRGALNYKWTPDVLTYVSYATGFKGGGVNPRPVDIEQVVPFAPETLTTTEIGLKSSFLDHRLQFNSAAFLNSYKNLQLSIYTPDGSSIVSNAGKVRSWGLEAEVQARPVGPLLIDASFGYLNFRYLDLGAAALVAEPPKLDSYPVGVPRLTGDVGVQYEFDLGSKVGSVTPRLDYSYQTRTFYDPENSMIASQAPYGVLNGRLTWADQSNKWSVALEVANMTDKFYYLYETQQLEAYGTLVGTPSLPRTFLVTVRRTW